jgi:hypothetical protein
MPPFQDEYVVCPQCESRIRMLVIEGDPGYIIGAESDGSSRLLPVQGSASPHPSKLSVVEHDAILANVRAQLATKGKSHGHSCGGEDCTVGIERDKTVATRGSTEH